LRFEGEADEAQAIQDLIDAQEALLKEVTSKIEETNTQVKAEEQQKALRV
jgi:hypothetical protein